ncbi:MAG: electron transfer flavoprotein subunit beta/FixA family protein [Magnetococcales bacterium]|nr:electron transfer flavoprotein subunit beta/FixA family protein [Magnetococcales bacterium]
MNILVPVKTVADPAHPARPLADGSGVDLDGIGHGLNPFDEIALEAALQLREAGQATGVLAVSVGPPSWGDGLRTALAMGADRALRVATPPHPAVPDPLTVARALAAVVRREGSRLVIAGKQSVDGEHGQTGPMLAGLLDWPQATNVARLTLTADGLEVTREVDGGLECLALPRPAVVTTELRLNRPRYASLPNILKARRKPVEEITLEALGVIPTPGREILGVTAPPMRPPGLRVASVAELLHHLEQRGLLP